MSLCNMQRQEKYTGNGAVVSGLNFSYLILVYQDQKPEFFPLTAVY